MASKAKAVQAEVTKVRRGRQVESMKGKQPEFKNTTLCNVVRVPKLDSNGWEKSARGNLLLRTLCYAQDVDVSIASRDAADYSKWTVNVNGKVMSIDEAEKLCIGFASIKDTTTGLQYLVSDRDDMDAMPETTKKEIIRRAKRNTVIRRMEIVCKMLKSITQVQGLHEIFSDDEKAEIFNTPAGFMAEFKSRLQRKPSPEKKGVEKFLALRA